MTVLGVCKRVVNGVLKPVGVALVRRPATTLDGALERLAQRRVNINTVIDVGASDGSWSRRAMQIYPDANYLLVEANPQHGDKLRAFCRKHPKAQFTLAAAADRRGEIFFDASDTLGGVASTKRTQHYSLIVSATTLDFEAEERRLSGPFLVKLDTHGFEVPILNGAREVLNRAEVVVIECYNFTIARECLVFHQMCGFMSDLGFRVADMFDVLYRPEDGVFWQCDFLFLRTERPEFSRRTWT